MQLNENVMNADLLQDTNHHNRAQYKCFKYLNKVTLKFILHLHLFRFAADRSQQKRIQDIFPSQEEAVTVLIQVHGSKSELAMMATEDWCAVGGQQFWNRRGGRENDELWHSEQQIK